MKKLLYILCFIFSISRSYAQKNLVPDSSFEAYNYLASKWNDTLRDFSKILPNWHRSQYISGPGYFNTNYTFLEHQVPYNNFTQYWDWVNYSINYQPAKTGNGYILFQATWSFENNNLSVPYTLVMSLLQQPLEKNKIYRGAFYVNIDVNANINSSGISGFFSKNRVVNADEKLEQHITLKDSIISDTVNWTKITGLYKARGGEQWLNLAYIHTNSNKYRLLRPKKDTGNYIFQNWFYIEDVSVYETTSVIFPDTVCFNENVVFTSNFNAPFKWYSGNTLLSNDSIYTFKATQSGYYILKSKNRTDTFYLTVLNAKFNLGNDTFICNGKSLNLKVPIALNSYLWNTSEKSSFINVIKGGLYSVTATNNFGCIHSDSIFIERKPDNYNNELQYINEYCTDDSIYTTIQLSKNYTYKWLNDNDTNTIKKLYSSSCYPILINDTFGCSLQDNICIDLCPSVFNIPNAFVPMGANKVFKPVGSNIKDMSMAIYNRWGEIMYQDKGKEIGWNGMFKNVVCPMGIYIYIITYTTFQTPQAQTLKGVLELLE